MVNILYLEDDKKLGEILANDLRLKGFHVDLLSEFRDFEETDFGDYDLIILDRLVGKFDTKEWLEKNKKRIGIPIIILSAINTPNEKADLLDIGADDYIGKPFSTHELLARLNAILRRSKKNKNSYLQVGNTVIDLHKRLVMVESKNETLPAKEFLLLVALCEEPGRVLNRNNLLDRVWESNLEVETHVVEATMANLRKRLSSLNSTILIRNMRNAGYWVED